MEPVLRLTFRLLELRENQPFWKSGLLTHRRPQPPRQLPHINFPRIHDQAVKVVAASATSKFFVKMTLGDQSDASNWTSLPPLVFTAWKPCFSVQIQILIFSMTNDYKLNLRGVNASLYG